MKTGIGIGGFGTRPFDGEGLPTRRTVLVENGILKNYVLNTYTARKLGMASTGNASRSLASNPGIGAGNFYLEPGTLTPEQIIGDVKSGLYVTETMGFGVNLVTGDYSAGRQPASGSKTANSPTPSKRSPSPATSKTCTATSPPSATTSSSAAPAPPPPSASKA